MARKNTTRFAILGMLSYLPMSGYDMKKFSDRSLNHFWKENYGAIYPQLKLLESEGLVILQGGEEEGRAERKVYAITSAGRETLAEWVNIRPDPPVQRHEILLKLFFGHRADKEKMIAMVEEHLTYSRRLLKELEKIEDSIKDGSYQMESIRLTSEINLNKMASLSQEGSPFWVFTVKYGIYYHQGVIAWAKETLNMLKNDAGKKPGEIFEKPGQWHEVS